MQPPVETLWGIFLVFLRLGLSSFGGPLAHLGYFRQEFVQRRRWLGEHAYAELVALGLGAGGPAGVLKGLQLVAVAVVAQALWGMARSLCRGPLRMSIALPAAVLVALALLSSGRVPPWALVLAGGAVGARLF